MRRTRFVAWSDIVAVELIAPDVLSITASDTVVVHGRPSELDDLRARIAERRPLATA